MIAWPPWYRPASYSDPYATSAARPRAAPFEPGRPSPTATRWPSGPWPAGPSLLNMACPLAGPPAPSGPATTCTSITWRAAAAAATWPAAPAGAADRLILLRPGPP